MARPLLLLTVPAVVLATGLLGLAAVRANQADPAVAHYAPLVRSSVVAADRASRVTTPKTKTLPEPSPAPAPTPQSAQPVVSIHSALIGGIARQWEEITPGVGTSASTPIIVVLHGQAANAALEVDRDAMVPLVADGRAELVYPQGIGNSWNAGGCCGPAFGQNVNDLGFVQTLVQLVDPGHTQPIYLAGYSNGGRLAYTVVCDDPSLVDGFAIVDAVPVSGCTPTHAASLLQIDGTADPAIAYVPGQQDIEGGEAATTAVAQMRAADGCAPTPTNVQAGTLVTATYSCRPGVRLVFATYQGATHAWPVGSATTPGAGMAIWAFVGQGRPW